MGQNDAREFGIETVPVECVQPGPRTHAFVLTTQRTGEQGDSSNLNRCCFKQQVQIGGPLTQFLLHVAAAPNSASSSMVVVARDHHHRDGKGADQLKHFHR